MNREKTEVDKLAEVIKPAAAHDFWPQKAAELALAAGYRQILVPNENLEKERDYLAEFIARQILVGLDKDPSIVRVVPGDMPIFFSDQHVAEALIAAGWRQLPGIISTEWGTTSDFGVVAARDRETAERKVANMRQSGYEADVVWRGVTEWQRESRNEQ